MRDARRCTAKSKQSGKRCRANVMLKPDGSYTTTCRNHGGGHQLRAPGDPQNGGKPRDSGIYAERIKQSAEFQARVRAQIGKLDDELVLLRCNLDDLLERADAHPDVVERARLLGFVGEHVDRIARVEERRARTLATLQGLDTPPEPMRLVLDGHEPEDPSITDDARQRLRDKLLRDE